MVPKKFNIVEFGGFDLAGQYGEAIPGIYDKIVDAHWNCVYIMCFGLKFGGFDIAPQYMVPEMFSDHIMLNGIISIDQNDVITIPGIEPAPVEPIIVPLSADENGVYTAPEGVDGYNPVEVDVEPVILPVTFEGNGTFTPPSGVDGYAPVTVNVSGGTGFGQRLVALEYDLNNGGYIAGSEWYVSGGSGTMTDIYQVEAGKRYLVALGSNVGTRFRVAFFDTNPAQATGRLAGQIIGFDQNNPPKYSVKDIMFLAPRNGYIGVGKDSVGTTGLQSYIFEVLY